MRILGANLIHSVPSWPPPLGGPAASPPDTARTSMRVAPVRTCVLALLAASALLASNASANDAVAKITCTGVTFVFQNFPSGTNVAHEKVYVDNVQVASTDF